MQNQIHSLKFGTRLVLSSTGNASSDLKAIRSGYLRLDFIANNKEISSLLGSLYYKCSFHVFSVNKRSTMWK